MLFKRNCFFLLRRNINFSFRLKHDLNVAVIGSGPAGFYFTGSLQRLVPDSRIDVFEKQPLPFGLARYGVAPDHPEVKNCIHQFESFISSSDNGINFFGNVSIGTDVTIEELRSAYDVVVLAYGAQADKPMGIPGEKAQNCISARSFVGWYNGLPQDKNLEPKLDCETALVVGAGNVALDVARILLSPIDRLAETDTTEYALEALKSSKITRVLCVGRRGPLQAAFTIKEVREILNLSGLTTLIQPDGFLEAEQRLGQLARPRKRITELMLKSLKNPSTPSDDQKQFVLQFLRSPTEILADSTGRVSQVRLAVNNLEISPDSADDDKCIMTNDTQLIDCGLVLFSIGYRSVEIQGVPFDKKFQRISTDDGNHVTGMGGVYACGWCAKGPTGVIATTQLEAKHCATVLKEDISKGVLISDPEKAGRKAIESLLSEKKIRWVSWDDWVEIDKAEQELGHLHGKTREKFTNIERIMKLVH